MRRLIAVIVVLAVVGAGCDGGEAATAVPSTEATTPSTVQTAVTTTTTIPATTTTADGHTEAASCGLLGEERYPAPRHEGVELLNAWLCGEFLGVIENEWVPVAVPDRSPVTDLYLVFDFGSHPGTGERVIGRFLLGLSDDLHDLASGGVMESWWLPENPMPPGWWTGKPPLGDSLEGLKPPDSSSLLQVGERYLMVVTTGTDPEWNCIEETLLSPTISPDPVEMCEDRVADGDLPWAWMVYNRALVDAMKGDGPVPTVPPEGWTWYDMLFLPPYDDPVDEPHRLPDPHTAFPNPPEFILTFAHSDQEECGDDGCTDVDIVLFSPGPDAFDRYLDAVLQEGWTVIDPSPEGGTRVLGPDRRFMMTILGSDDDLPERLDRFASNPDHLVFVLFRETDDAG